jgi:hypothetical protein
MEEKVLKIGEVIKGFHIKIEDLQLHKYTGNTTRGKRRKRENDDDSHSQHQESGGRMHKTLRGKCTNMDRSGRRSRDEGRGRKIKGSTGKGPESFRENKHPSTS